VSATLRFDICVDVEHTEHEVLGPDEEQIEEFIESLTPDDWERYGAYIDRPELDIDVDDVDDEDTMTEPCIAFKGGRFCALTEA
jgi:hypothetical protein